MTCKDCLHNGLCKDMHKFGVVDLPYNDDGAACDHYKSSADVVEVVRCKDCKYCGTSGCAMDVYSFDVVEEGYCSYGERKTE